MCTRGDIEDVAVLHPWLVICYNGLHVMHPGATKPPGGRKEHVMENLEFPPDSERSMVEFMNEHYAHSNLMYAKVYGQLWQATEARMAAIDKEGMELEVTVPDGTRRIRIPFEHRLQDEGDA